MEDSERSDCENNIENASKENDTTNSENNVSQEKLSLDNKSMESGVSKINSLNENLNSDSKEVKNNETEIIASKENVSEETVDASPQIEFSSQHTFKKPGLLSPRKGKPIIRKVVNPSDSHSADPVEKSEITENESMSEDYETKSDSEIVMKFRKETQIETEKEVEKSKETQFKKEKQKHMIIENERQIPLPYKEPSWSGKPEKQYKAEVLKSGLILETIDLSEKNFHIIGRLPVCDISLAHPTISRYHAVFQYRSEPDEKNEKGLYVYDFGSTHGTFWNGNRIRPNIYVRIRGGHMIKFGNSQRKFIMQTPSEEEEEESELTITELKEKRRLEIEERMKVEMERQKEEELAEKLRLKKEETEGIDWGMSEDADEETDLKENPYAQTNNEELFLDDPKKTLRGWFEREGHELQYQAEENGIGRFTCWVELPIEDYVGRSARAEASVKGKKKEAVIQCALEACRILDRHGLLRQAVHESKKKKARNWEQEDFYDSDEDNFLDRTGTVEKKREQRMRNAGKLNAKAETYSSLTEKYSEVVRQIESIENRLKESQNSQNMEASSSIDALDAFMSQLKSTTILNKSETTKLKMDLQKLRKDEEQLLKLIEISKPANLPALKPHTSRAETFRTKRKSINDSPKFEKKIKSSKISQSTEEQETNQEEESKHSPRKSEFSENESSKKSVVEVSKSRTMIIKKSENSDSDNVTSKQSTEEDTCERIAEDEEGNKNEDEDIAKKKKRNMKRIQQRALKAEKEKIKSYEEEEYQDDYCTWVPPEGQSGDGKTSLNEKFGY